MRLESPDGPPDEITRLGSTLNAMLDAQERAAARQKQLIDDASHELRTPLTTLSAEIELALRKRRTAARTRTPCTGSPATPPSWSTWPRRC